MEQPHEGPSVLGWNDLKEIIQPQEGLHSLNGTTPGESLSLRMERPQGSHSVLG